MFKNLLLFTFCLMLSSSLWAQNDNIESQIFVPPGSTYEATASETIKRQKSASLPPRQSIDVNEVSVSIVHYHYMEPDQFGLLMRAADITSGCFTVSPLEYDVKFIADQFVDVKIKSFRRTIKKTQNPQFDCDQKSQAVTGLVVLNAKDLQKRGIQQIRFENGKTRDVYKVSYQKNSITLTPESMVAFKANGLTGPDKDRLVYFHSVKNLIALHVPMAKNSDDVLPQINTLAARNSLRPVNNGEGVKNDGDNHVYFFLDTRGRFLSQLNEDGYTPLGEIRVSRPFIGQQGLSSMPVPLKVFATRPETTL